MTKWVYNQNPAVVERTMSTPYCMRRTPMKEYIGDDRWIGEGWRREVEAGRKSMTRLTMPVEHMTAIMHLATPSTMIWL